MLHKNDITATCWIQHEVIAFALLQKNRAHEETKEYVFQQNAIPKQFYKTQRWIAFTKYSAESLFLQT